ncbi:putative transposase [Rhizobium hainanense]|uniref:Putative transposase n=1 Tax=Rhizobium hainanense TaxID=52131 RepID=A0A1C3V2A0_9HYPH|nr:putative transposase [Rhizobium hainanense]
MWEQNTGYVYLAGVIDLYSRRVLQSRQNTDVVLHALLMAVRRRRRKRC